MTRIANSNINYVLIDIKKLSIECVCAHIKEYPSYILVPKYWHDNNIYVQLSASSLKLTQGDTNYQSYMVMSAVTSEQLSFLTLKNLIRTDVDKILLPEHVLHYTNRAIIKQTACSNLLLNNVYIDKEHQLQYGYRTIVTLSPIEEKDMLINTVDPIITEFFLSVQYNNF